MHEKEIGSRTGKFTLRSAISGHSAAIKKRKKSHDVTHTGTGGRRIGGKGL